MTFTDGSWLTRPEADLVRAGSARHRVADGDGLRLPAQVDGAQQRDDTLDHAALDVEVSRWQERDALPGEEHPLTVAGAHRGHPASLGAPAVLRCVDDTVPEGTWSSREVVR